jgi:hypothetical protein
MVLHKELYTGTGIARAVEIDYVPVHCIGYDEYGVI